MSLDIVHPVKVDIGRFDVRSASKIPYGVAANAPQDVTYAEYAATNPSSGNIQINCQPPTRTIVGRRAYLKMTVSAVITTSAVAGQTPINLGTGDAFRMFPIQAVTQNLTVRINNGQIQNGAVLQTMPYLLRCKQDRNSIDRLNSTSPAMQDAFITYGSGVASNRNPLGLDVSNTYEVPRGSATADCITSAITNPVGGTEAKFTATIVEPMFCSPFQYEAGPDMEGFLGVESIQVVLQLAGGNLSRMWSRADLVGGTVLASAVFTITAASVLLTQATPNVEYVLPKQVSMSYVNLSFNSSAVTAASIAPSVAFSNVVSQSISLSSYPRRIFVWCCPASSTTINNPLLTDCCQTALTSARITWDSRTVLSTANEQQLYLLSVKNGLEASFHEWHTGVASVLIIDPAADLGLPFGAAAGLNAKIQFQITLGGFNRSASAGVEFQIVVLPIYDGIVEFTNTDQLATVNVLEGPLSTADVLGAKESPELTHKESESFSGGGIVGGSAKSFFRGLKTGLNKVARGIQKVSGPLRFVPGLRRFARPAGAIASGVRAMTGGRARMPHRRHFRGMGLDAPSQGPYDYQDTQYEDENDGLLEDENADLYSDIDQGQYQQ